ncbi:MAG: response regulator [Desulfobacteraceae bacterium]|nr:response regulator [Desulfobacteraceae bacterium]
MNEPKILIIDDEPGICETLSGILEEKGYLTYTAGNAGKAIETVRNNSVNIALIDLILPDMPGMILLEKIKELSPGTEAIIVTGHASLDTAVQAIHDRVFSYVSKPVDIDHLEVVITRALEKQKLQTDRNRAEAALRESEERYRQFFEEDLSGAYISEPDGTIIACNPAFARIFRLPSPREPMNMNLASFYPDPYVWTAFLERLRNEKKLENYELEMIRSDETLIHVIANTVGVFDDKDCLTEVKGYLIDVTERKKLEVQLRQSQKMEALGALAGGIAHDFNNILFPIIGYSEITMDYVPDGSLAQKNLEQILIAAERASELIKQILTFSRQGEHKKKPLKMQLIIKEALKLVRSTLPSTIEIKRKIKECGPVLADPSQIHQVIMNLCTNAYYSMREKGGILEVTLEEVEIDSDEQGAKLHMTSGLYLKLSVSDTGHGMDKVAMERIFDPFFTTRKREEGTGLGLSVVHGIVTSHDGHVSVYSEPDKGAVFNIYLPMIEMRDSEYEIKNSPEPVPTGTERILLVDDEGQIAVMEKQMLERLGYHVTIRTSSPDALELFRTKPEKFDLVITDMTMPNMTGLELSGELLHIRPDIPIILCTGFSEIISEEKAKLSGIRKFVMKPMLRVQIAKIIREVADDL